MIFKKLPEVKSCCHCFSLKVGVVLIGLYFITLSLIQHGFSVDLTSEECYSSLYEENCRYKDIMPYLMYIVYFEAFMSFLPSTFLIMAVFINNRNIITMFLYFVTISMAIDMIYDAGILLINLIEVECRTMNKWTIVRCFVTHIIIVICFTYFVIVVKSYRSTLKAYQRRSVITDSHGHKILMKDGDNISKYGRVNVTRRYKNGSNTKESKTNTDIDKTNADGNDKSSNDNKTNKYVYESGKNVYSIRINSSRNIVDESYSNSEYNVTEGQLALITTDVNIKEMMKTSTQLFDITSTQLNKYSAQMNIINTENNINIDESIIKAYMTENIIEYNKIDKEDSKMDANVNIITSEEEIENNKGVENSYSEINTYIISPSAKSIEIITDGNKITTKLYEANTETNNTGVEMITSNNLKQNDTNINEIYRHASYTADITSAEMVATCKEGSKTNTNVNKSTSEE